MDNFSLKFGLEEPKKEILEELKQVEIVEKDESAIIKDYEESRKKINNVLEIGSSAIGELALIAKQSGDPEAYAVLSNLIKNVADITGNLSKQHKDYMELKKHLNDTDNKSSNNIKSDTLTLFKLLNQNK